MRRRVATVIAFGVLLVASAGCGGGSGVSEPVPIALGSSSTVSPAVTTSLPPSTTSVAIPTTTVSTPYKKGAPCSADVLAALLAEARRWAAAHAAPGIVTTVPSAQCAEGFAFGSMECEYVDHPTWGCQKTGAIFHTTAGEWTLIREGNVYCPTEPDPIVRAGCDAVGRIY